MTPATRPPSPGAPARRGGDEARPSSRPSTQQRARLGLVAVQPQVAGDQRADRQRGQDGRQDQRSPGAPESARTSSIASAPTAPTRRHDDRERAGCRDAAPGMAEAYPVHARSEPMLRRTVARVSDASDATEPASPARRHRDQHASPKTESHDPAVPEAYAAFMRDGLGRPRARPAAATRSPTGPPRAAQRLAEAFPGERLVLPAGSFKVRANDTDYRFRPDTAHTYLSGNQTSDAVLVIEDGESVLYARPRSSRDTDEFFRDRQYGELWAGRRPSLKRDLGLARPRGAATSTSSRPRSGAPARPACCAASTPASTGWSPPTRPATRDFARVALRAAAGQGRLGGRPAPGGLRHHHARLRGLGARVGPGARVRRALDRGHLLPPGPGDGQRHRLRLDRRRRPARHDAALDRELRPDHARRAGAARHGRRGPPRSTPPT